MYDATGLFELDDREAVVRDVHDTFFEQSGCMILRGVFENQTMDRFNTWSERALEEAAGDRNSRHPIQPDKRLVNDLVRRMAETDPEMLVELLGNPTLTRVADVLLGFMAFGSATVHCVEPGGKRQQTHVYYPLHLHSTPFWGGRLDKLRRMLTRHQVNNTLPKATIQMLVAVEAMD